MIPRPSHSFGLTFLSLIALSGATAADIDFASPHAAYATGSAPRTVAIGPLDTNSSNDLVVGNASSNTISVLLNNGDGTFQARTDFAIPGNPSSVAIIDLNGDGKNDVVVSNQITAGCISVFLGNGDGTFQVRTDFPAAANPVAMRVADMDADDIPDVVVAGTGINFFKGLGTGGFSAATQLVVGSYLGNSIAVGDINNDTTMDIAVTLNSRLTTLLGNGDGTFQPLQTWDTGAPDLSVGIGDFNGDGLNDLAETHFNGAQVAVLLNLGGGSFGAATTFPTGVGPKSLMISDLDGDGNLDLVCVNVTSHTVGILRGKGNGTFHPHIGYLTGARPYVDAVGDLDGNGSLDLATANISGHTVSVLLQGTGAAPGMVTSLTASPISDQYALLSWTTPVVESYGPATQYDLRLFLGTMTPGDFASAMPVAPGPAVGLSGSAASFMLYDLLPGTTYSAALTTSDAFGRTSPLSVITTFTTAASDVFPPASPTLTSTYTGNNYCIIRWTAPGDDGMLGTAMSYNLRMSTTAIVDDATFASAAAIPFANPKAGGQLEEALISGLSDSTTYYFAITATDEMGLISPRSTTLMVTTDTGDTLAPGRVSNLRMVGATTTTITVRWTARGEDGAWGQATAYDLRWSLDPITDESTFLAATQVPGLPAPALSGTVQEAVISGLVHDSVYYIALRVADEIPNYSTLSNVLAAATLEGNAPAAITNLAISTPTSSTLTLTWTAPGDDGSVGTATSYDVRYSTTPITTTMDFDAATAVTGEPAPQIAGTVEQLTLTGLIASTTYYVAIRTSDEVPNTSGLSNAASGTTTAAPGGGSGSGGGGSSGGGCGLGGGLAALLLTFASMLLLNVARASRS